MHSGFEFSAIRRQQPSPSTPTPTMNQTQILNQMHSLPTTQQQLFHEQQKQSNFLEQVPVPYFPKLGLNEICSVNQYKQQEHYQIPETPHSLEILHCWHDQQRSAITQQRFWEPIHAEASNEKSEVVEAQERSHFGELEAICKHVVVSNSVCVGGDDEKKKRKKKRRKQGSGGMSSPMLEFLGKLMKQMMDHQENLHRKFSEMLERLDGERREREKNWRNQELAQFEREAEARLREKTLARNRENVIVSYLEKITGHRVTNLSSFYPVENTSTSRGRAGGEKETRKGLTTNKPSLLK